MVRDDLRSQNDLDKPIQGVIRGQKGCNDMVLSRSFSSFPDYSSKRLEASNLPRFAIGPRS